MNFKEFAFFILQEYANFPVSGFKLRSQLAAGLVQRTSGMLLAPYYVTDLGLRKFEDPKIFFDENISMLPSRISAAYSKNASLELLRSSKIENFGLDLDLYLLYTGDYLGAEGVVQQRISELLVSCNYRECLYSGVVLGAMKNSEATRLLDHAANTSVTKIGYITATYRTAVARIKRDGQIKIGIKILNDLDQVVREGLDSGDLTNGDVVALHSMILNLRALGYLKIGDTVESVAQMQAAAADGIPLDLSVVGFGEAARYSAQENINLGQVLLDRDPVGAISVLEKNVNFCVKNCPDYISEALSCLAYAYFLVNKFDLSVRAGRLAVVRIANEASPARLRASREVLIGALAARGDWNEAQALLTILENDPLGLQSDEMSQIINFGVST